MKKSVKLTLPKPCDQNWDEMTPVQGGRHCDQCKHTIIDFRNFTDVQLAAYARQANGVFCGVTTADQLNRPLLEHASLPGTFNLRAVALGLGILLCVTPALASETSSPGMSLIECIASDTKLPPQSPSDTVQKIRIVVKSSEGVLLSDAQITFLDADFNTLGELTLFSDESGVIEFFPNLIPVEEYAFLSVSHNSHSKALIKKEDLETNQPYTIVLENPRMFLGEYIGDY